MKSFDEFNAWMQSAAEEFREERSEAIIRKWKARQYLDLAAEVAASLRANEYLTTDELKLIRETVDAMAIEKRDKIIAEALIDLAGERAE